MGDAAKRTDTACRKGGCVVVGKATQSGVGEADSSESTMRIDFRNNGLVIVEDGRFVFSTTGDTSAITSDVVGNWRRGAAVNAKDSGSGATNTLISQLIGLLRRELREN